MPLDIKIIGFLKAFNKKKGLIRKRVKITGKKNGKE